MAPTNGGVSVSAPCKRCKNNVLNGLKCINCSALFHQSCAKLVNNIKYTNDSEKSVICCGEQMSDGSGNMEVTDVAFYDAIGDINVNSINNHMLVYILKQKDLIIRELRDKIDLLSQQINLLNKIKEIDKTKENDKIKEKDRKKQIDTLNKDKEKDSNNDSCVNNANANVNSSSTNSVKTVTSQKTIGGVNSTKVMHDVRVCTENVNKRKSYDFRNNETIVDQCVSREMDYKENNNNKNSAEWKEVVHKSRNKLKRIVGKNSEVLIKGVPKLASLHVYRLDKNTTTDELRDMLKVNFPEVTCQALTSKYPEMYSSFKVSIYGDNYDKALDPAIWPQGACVNKFFHWKKKQMPPT